VIHDAALRGEPARTAGLPVELSAGLGLSVIETEEQLDRVIRRDFETKAPTGTEIMSRVEAGGYASR